MVRLINLLVKLFFKSSSIHTITVFAEKNAEVPHNFLAKDGSVFVYNTSKF